MRTCVSRWQAIFALYFETLWRTSLGMRNQAISTGSFKTIFDSVISAETIDAVLERCGTKRRCPPVIDAADFIAGLVFHVVSGPGTFAHHVKQLTGESITDSALSQRRSRLPQEVFDQVMTEALEPLADPQKHPEAFYHGLRLCGVDGTRFSVANTPSVKRSMRKAKSRRGRAAFAQVGAAVMVELGLHNPIAAALGGEEESEMVLARRLGSSLPERSLWICDRYYGVGEVLVGLPSEGQREFLVRVRANLKPRLVEPYPDGSQLVEIKSGQGTRWVREIAGQVRRGGGRATLVRVWTSLLDWRRHPAAELLALYARRWEQEGFYRELKVDTRSLPQLASHTQQTALQEVAALILGYAVLVRHRIEVAALGEVAVLRISFMKTLHIVRGLWQFLDLSADLLSEAAVRVLVRRALTQVAEMAICPRRHRSCPRAVRQPIRGWPRLMKNTYAHGACEVTVTHPASTNS